MYRDIMIDLETLSKEPYAAVIQLSACPFDQRTGMIAPMEERFDIRIMSSHYMSLGEYHVCNKTVAWWQEQDQAVRASVFCGTHYPYQAAEAFAAYLNLQINSEQLPELDSLRFWSRNILFDFPILKNLLEQSCVDYPVHYRNHRDVYQALDGIPEEVIAMFPRNPAIHNAASDALYQAKAVICAHHYRNTGEIYQW